MPRYTPKSHEQILTSMIARVVSRTNLNDIDDASSVKHVLSAAARQDAQQYYQIGLLLQLFNIDTAAGDDLIERAKDIQPGTMQIMQAKKAVGTVVFTRRGTTGTLSIPIGTRVKTSDGTEFQTTGVGTITATSPEQISGHGVGRDSNAVAVIAVSGGIAGNVVAGTVTQFSSKPAGVDTVTNLSKFSQGTDKETDDSFRSRLKAYTSSLSRCNPSALESLVIGQQDPITGATVLFSKVVEDLINRGYVELFIDDGNGTAESVVRTALALPGTWTWAGTTTVLSTDTSTVAVGDFIRKDSSATTWFEISAITPNVNVTLLNPGSAVIPTGSGASSAATDKVTNGLNGPPAGSAVGGETTLYLENKPVKDTEPVSIVSSVRGNLVQNTTWFYNPASGQIDFDPALVAGERIWADYTYFVGLIAYVQKLVDGDPNDRTNFPGYRAAGILTQVKSPQVLFQVVSAAITVKDGYDQAEVRTAVRQAIKDYVNSLQISGDFILAEATKRVMGVAGVYDVRFTIPAANTPVLDDQLLRTTDGNITVV